MGGGEVKVKRGGFAGLPVNAVEYTLGIASGVKRLEFRGVEEPMAVEAIQSQKVPKRF